LRGPTSNRREGKGREGRKERKRKKKAKGRRKVKPLHPNKNSG